MCVVGPKPVTKTVSGRPTAGSTLLANVSYGAPPGWPLSEQALSDSRYLYVNSDPDQPDSANVVLTIQPLQAGY